MYILHADYACIGSGKKERKKKKNKNKNQLKSNNFLLYVITTALMECIGESRGSYVGEN